MAAAAFPDQRQGPAQRIRRRRPVAACMGRHPLAGGGRHIAPDRGGPLVAARHIAEVFQQLRRLGPPCPRQCVEILHSQEGGHEICVSWREAVGEAGPAVAHLKPRKLDAGEQADLVDLVL